MQHSIVKKNLEKILDINEDLSRIRDLDTLLNRVLFEARRITHADAGSIYLVEGQELAIEYVQNDTLRRQRDRSSRFEYFKQILPIDQRSIAGYVAQTVKPLRIQDAYSLPSHLPFAFNPSFDEASGYRTRSILTVPLVSGGSRIIGVLQIINAQNDEGQVTPFNREDLLLVSLFATQAAAAIMRARMTRDLILRMIQMAELRDPEETGQHVKRVGAYAVELFHRWAEIHRLSEAETAHTVDILRIAAMLHDVGKLAISDTILKKTSSLSHEEYDRMKWHTVLGAQLFSRGDSDWDQMAAEIALGHHEHWDGSGYPGVIPDLNDPQPRLGPGKTGEAIPLSARIVALADVYDALASPRSYKASWPNEDVVRYIESKRGQQFDPQLVDIFLELQPVFSSIREKYR
jgi:HD-GYP domain-containing protein (c-di-GMP phosphodiesterase class II)